MLRQQQAAGVGGVGGGGSKLSPSHLGVGVAGSKLPGVEALGHAGLGGSVADMHPKAHGGYSGEGSAWPLPACCTFITGLSSCFYPKLASSGGEMHVIEHRIG